MSKHVSTGLAERVIEGQRYIAATRTSAGLRASAAELDQAVDQLGCLDLFPASPHADAVAAVAVALNESLRVVTLAEITIEGIDKVVVVEAVAVSGIKVRRAVHAVRQAGAHWVGAAVLKDLGGEQTTNVTDRFGAVDGLRAAD
jgi:hypothetical protein